eukprot:PhF_6_TR32394/c0_g1_i1/m.48058/K04886/KCNB2; potassium voltage-gated channel Shab-related subfamily B member 2
MAIPSSVEYLRILLAQHTSDFDEELYVICHDYCTTNGPAFHSLQKAKSKQFIETKDLKLYSLREQIEIVMEKPFATPYGRAMFFAQTIIVIASVIAMMMETIPAYNPIVNPSYDRLWYWMEGGMTFYFTCETALRFIVAKDKKDFFMRPTNIMDVVSVLPFYVELVAQGNKDHIAAFRIVRLFRLMKFLRNLQAIDNLVMAVERSARALVAPVVFLGACMLFMSGLVYYAEKGDYDTTTNAFMINDCACESSPKYHLWLKSGKNLSLTINGNTTYITDMCPKKESDFYSIPHTLWWAVVTMATVGYGDLVPKCWLGKMFASISIVLGVFFMAMPIAIVGSYFTMVVDENEKQAKAAKEKVSKQGREERKKLMDKVLAKELHTCSDDEIEKFCRNVKIAVRSTRRDTEALLYQIVAPPDSANMSLAKDVIRFLSRTLPNEPISLEDPSPAFLHQMEVHLGKMLNNHTLPQEYKEHAKPSLCCPGVLVNPEHKWLSYIMQKPLAVSVGGMCLRNVFITPPDIELPFMNLPQRVATLYVSVTPVDWVIRIASVPPIVVKVNGEPVGETVEEAALLRSGDTLDFGTAAQPCVVTFQNVNAN